MKTFLPIFSVIFLLIGLTNGIWAQTMVEGTVTDVLGRPLSNVQVKIKGTDQSVTSTSEGTFSLSSEKKSGKLIFIYPDFEQNVKKFTAGEKLEVVLTSSPSKIKTVSNGYSTDKKKDMTGSASTVDPKGLAKGSGDVRGQLQGRFPGVSVTTTNGVFKVRIRGVSSFNSPTEPLYIVDNVPMSDVSSLNPDNIESISVLKDAAETSIYGARGAAGVIIITTKH